MLADEALAEKVEAHPLRDLMAEMTRLKPYRSALKEQSPTGSNLAPGGGFALSTRCFSAGCPRRRAFYRNTRKSGLVL